MKSLTNRIYIRKATEPAGTGRDIYAEGIPAIKPGDEIIEVKFSYIPSAYEPLYDGFERVFKLGLGEESISYDFWVKADGSILVRCPWEGCGWEEWTGSITYPVSVVLLERSLRMV